MSDVLEVEARRRYLESLSLYERQGTKEGPEAAVDELSGLGVAIAVSSERKLLAPRATVGTATEISHHLAVLMTWLGICSCPECGEDVEIFSTELKVKCSKCGSMSFEKNVQPKYKLVGTHTARRSFATNLYLAEVPSISIMKITGHKTEKSFLQYIRVTQKENADKLLTHPFFN